MLYALASLYLSPFFTFQSGSIQIRIEKQIIYVSVSLHSNLVLFKCGTAGAIVGRWDFFTFQSGSIQIYLKRLREWETQKLYIPIWFYSNYGLSSTGDSLIKALHSNLVLFKSFSNQVKSCSHLPLHSNLVLFKLLVSMIVNAGANFTFQSGSIQIMSPPTGISL